MKEIINLPSEKRHLYKIMAPKQTLGLPSLARDCQISRYLNYPANLRLHQPEVAISGIFGRGCHPKISWNSLQNIQLFVRCVFTRPNTRTMRKR